MITYKLTGSDQLWDTMKTLSAKMRDRILRKAVTKASKKIEESAQQHVSVDMGTLRDAIQTRITSGGEKGNVVKAYIGIRRGIKVPVRKLKRGKRKGETLVAIPTRYANLVERGHNLVRNGKIIGRVKAKPFMRPAWDEWGGDVALYTIADVAQAELASIEIQRAVISTSTTPVP